MDCPSCGIELRYCGFGVGDSGKFVTYKCEPCYKVFVVTSETTGSTDEHFNSRCVMTIDDPYLEVFEDFIDGLST